MKVFRLVPGQLLFAVVVAQPIDLDISIVDTYSLVHVSLGTPPVDHSLLFDTGSSTLWLIDSNCTTGCLNTSGHNRTSYDLSASSTGSEVRSVNASIDYLGGTITGVLASDIATIGNASFNQSFASAIKSTWQNLPADGFLGLASSSIAFPRTTSFFENMMQKGLAYLPRFGIYTGSANVTMANPSPTNNGVLTLGGSRESDFADGPVKFVDLSTPFEVYKVPFYSWNMTTKNKSDTNLAWKGQVVFDTGSNIFNVPNEFVSQMYDATPWTYSSLMNGTRPLCSEFTDDWSVSFTIGAAGAQQTYTVKGSMLAERGYQDDDHCFPPFNPWASHNIIVGKLWMRNFYSVFDFGSFNESSYHMRVGFAPLKAEYLPRL